jgi:hypothetical protein
VHELALPHHPLQRAGWSLLHLCSRACVKLACESEPPAMGTERAQDVMTYQ